GTSLAGSEVSIDTGGNKERLRARLAKQYVPGKIIAAKRPAPIRGFRVEYASVQYIRQAEIGIGRRFMHWDPGILPGVTVNEVLPNSKAAAAGLRPGDQISHLNGTSVSTPAEFYKEAARLGADTPMELTLVVPERQFLNTTTLRIE